MTDTLTLESELGVASARTIATSLTDKRGHDVTLDASAVEHVCAPVVQIMLAAKMAWEGDGHEFVITNPSDSFRTCLDLLGLSDKLLGEQA